MKNKFYWFAVLFSVLLTFGFICACVGTFHADNIDWQVEKKENTK